MKHKISVIIPVYNGVPLLSQALDSVLCQEYPAYETIVVDDGSTDETDQILDRYRDRVKIVKLDHQGVSNARNAGIRIAAGDYIAFLDHDDFWFKNKLKRQIYDATCHPDVGIFSCNYFLRRSGRLAKHYENLRYKTGVNFDTPLSAHSFAALIRENFIGTPSAVLIRRDIAQSVLFDPRYTTCEDYDFFLRCSLNTKMLLNSAPLLFKKSHAKNTTLDGASLYKDHLRVLVSTFESRKAYIHKQGLAPLCKQAIAEIHYILGNQFYESGKIKMAFGEYFSGLKNSLTFKNICLYIWTSFKKLIRLLSLNSLRRDKIKFLQMRGDANCKTKSLRRAIFSS